MRAVSGELRRGDANEGFSGNVEGCTPKGTLILGERIQGVGSGFWHEVAREVLVVDRGSLWHCVANANTLPGNREYCSPPSLEGYMSWEREWKKGQPYIISENHYCEQAQLLRDPPADDSECGKASRRNMAVV